MQSELIEYLRFSKTVSSISSYKRIGWSRIYNESGGKKQFRSGRQKERIV